MPRNQPTAAKWIKLLVAISQRPGLKESADNVLEGIAKYVRDGMETNPTSRSLGTDADTQNSQIEADESNDDGGVYLHMSGSTLALPVRRLLSRFGWIRRMTWANILATFGAHFPSKFQDAPSILFELAKHDPDTDVRHACLKFLCQLSEQCKLIPSVSPVVTQGLGDETIAQFDEFVKNWSWRARFGYAKLISAVGESKEYELPDDVLEKLSKWALSDTDYDCRSEVVNIFLNLLKVERLSKGRYQQYVDTMVKDYLPQGLEDISWTVRRSWIKLAGATQIKDAQTCRHQTGLLLNAAIKDGDSDVQTESMKALQRLLENSDFRASVTVKLAELLGSSLQSSDDTDRTMTALTTITTPLQGLEKEVQERHQLWVQIIFLLGRNAEFQALPKLIEVVIESRDTLHSLFQNVKLPDPIDGVLPKAIESALKPDGKPNIRSAAMNLFSALIGCVPGHGDDQPRYESFLGQNSDGQIISRLTDIAIKDDDDDLRITALSILKSAYKAKDYSRFRDAIKATLSKTIENSLKDQENSKLRAHAVSAVGSLTEHNAYGQYRDIVSPYISRLLKMVLIEGDKTLGENAEKVLFDNFMASAAETELSHDVFIAIPPMVATITPTGKAVVLRLAGTILVSDYTAATIAHALIPMLRSTSTFARATTTELLLKLYTKHRRSMPQLIDPAIPEIIALALEDKDNTGEIRITSIQLLAANLSSESTGLASDGKAKTSTATTSSVLKQITPLVTKFTELLQVDHLRPFVVELLSLMSLDPAARQTMTLRIASTVFGPENPTLAGYVELLTRIISDGRLGEMATDYMVLFLAPALVTRPQLSSYKFKILTALWCRYGQRTLKNDASPETSEDKGDRENERQKLLKWLTLALFGRHVITHEAKTWKERCSRYLRSLDSEGGSVGS